MFENSPGNSGHNLGVAWIGPNLTFSPICKGVLDDRVRAGSTIGQQRGEAAHGGHGGEKCSFGFLIMHLINVLVRDAAPRQLHAENASSFRFNSYSLPP